MKTSVLLQLAAVSSAFVLPDQDVLAQVEIQTSEKADSFVARLPSTRQLIDAVDDEIDSVADRVRDSFGEYKRSAHKSLDEALSKVSAGVSEAAHELSEEYFDAQAWINTESDDILTADLFGIFERHRSDESQLAHEKSETSEGHHGHHKGNETVYQLIAKSKYTTKLRALIDDYPDIVEALNSTDAHYTVFAPTDEAFKKAYERRPKDEPKLSKEALKKILSYHVSPDFYPAGRVLATRTIPTFLKSEHLAKEPTAQRLGTEISFRGLTVNYYSRIIAVNIFGSNGVIHGVDSLILPPPPVLKIVDLLPEEFSTLELGLIKTGLFDAINGTEHTGGTLFAPANYAFQKLGPGANAFLFSPRGLKYLKALLEYHIVADQTLYSDYYLDGRDSSEQTLTNGGRGPPRGYKHFDLETVLEDKSLAIDVSRYGRLIDITINGYTHVIRSDGVAQDGVVHEINNVLVPPHSHGDSGMSSAMWDGESEMSVEELVGRLEPYTKPADIPEDL
ncbi:MAG: hypothetical protein Q9162_001224 [Coniocarpon cinnabarinum]